MLAKVKKLDGSPPAKPSAFIIKKCDLCEDGKLTRLTASIGNQKSNVTVYFDKPDYMTATEKRMDSETRYLCNLIGEATGVDILNEFRWVPIIRCCVPKIRQAYFRNCERFRLPFQTGRTILFGKSAVSWMMYEGNAPSDMWILHGRKVLRDNVETIGFIGTELMESYRERPDRLRDLLKDYKEKAAISAKSLMQWRDADHQRIKQSKE